MILAGSCPSNASPSPIVGGVVGKVIIVDKLVQSWNPSEPIEVTVEGIVIDVNDVQFSNASFPIVRRPSFNVIDVPMRTVKCRTHT